MREEEPLAIFDATGNRIGVKSRAQVHRDHDWHELVFVWSCHLAPDRRPRTLLQIRAREGDPYLGNLDSLAAGHVNASESHRQGAQREILEEVGVEVTLDDLVYLEMSPLENTTGKCRRVLQHHYLCQRRIDLREVVFNEEVSGFVELDVADLLDLLNGERTFVEGNARYSDRDDFPTTVEVTPDAFSSYSKPITDSFRRAMTQILALPSGP